MSQFVQDEKIQISRATINRLQRAERFPKEYRSSVGTPKQKNVAGGKTADRNSYDDPARFFNAMHGKPKLWRNPFFFRALRDEGARILEAAEFASLTAAKQMARYPKQTGAYSRSLELYVLKGGRRRVLRGREDLADADENTKFQLVSTLPYSSTAEKNSLRIYREGGILFYAAMMTRKKFPDVAVRFTYQYAQEWGQSHNMAIPVLTIGDRRQTRDKIIRPGKKYMSRQRRRKRIANRGY